MTDLAVSVRGLRKRYGSFDALRGIDLAIARGEVFALLGPNGAGKTTTVEILEGHRHRTDGTVDVLGYDPAAGQREFKERIGIVLQETGVEPYLTVEETASLFRSYYPHPRPVGEVLELVGLESQRRVRVKQLSGGQKRRLDVAIGLAGGPELLFLDEPTTGFDPAARRDAWEMVKGLQRLGTTIFLTTHYMDEAQYLADRVAIIRDGAIVAEGTPASLIAMEPNSLISFRLDGEHEGLLAGLGSRHDGGGRHVIETRTPTATLYELTRRAHQRGIELEDLNVSRGTLEDMYLRLVEEPGSKEEPA